MRIIAALDIIGGKCVRLTQGDFSSKIIYNEDPVEAAIEMESYGVKYLHVVDLDGAKNRSVAHLSILEKIGIKTNLEIDFGGGIRSAADLKNIFNAGARQITIGSIAVSNRKLFLSWLNEFGDEKIILGADCSGRKVSACGWTEQSDNDIISFISGYRSKGVKYTICTDIDKDGMLQGPSVELYRDILAVTDVRLIASGGISCVKDVEDLDKAGCEGAVIGKAIYEGKISLKELGKYA